MTELFKVEKLEELPVKASDLAAETNRDPVLKHLNFILKGWPTQVTQKDLQPYFRHQNKLTGKDMKTSLRNFLARYRVTPHCSTGITPCELLMKRHLRTKLDLIQPTSQSLDKHKKKSEKQQDLNEFNKGDKVWARYKRLKID